MNFSFNYCKVSDGNGIEKNTAVYGAKANGGLAKTISENKLGKMKINGAKQLAKKRIYRIAIIVSKDTFRKYPETKNYFDDRFYFAHLLDELKLYNEALDEFKSIKVLELKPKQASEVNIKIESVSMKLVSE
ncbi:MAG: hypothetical protein PF445_10750 [Melioribacteraceae bacterium]|jgi:hypothetical protein|nr:hypothetical protein [Melioribacteraceae bacterium]